jgi:hypothetical protein
MMSLGFVESEFVSGFLNKVTKPKRASAACEG